MTRETLKLRHDLTTGEASAPIGLLPPVTNGGERPPLFVARDEVFFWTREWQAGEQESAAERAAGNLRRFRSASDFMDWLQSADD